MCEVFSVLQSFRPLQKQKRGLNCHTLLDGRRKPEDEDVEIAAHAYGVRTACSLASSENFLRFLTQVKAKRFLSSNNVLNGFKPIR